MSLRLLLLLLRDRCLSDYYITRRGGGGGQFIESRSTYLQLPIRIASNPIGRSSSLLGGLRRIRLDRTRETKEPPKSRQQYLLRVMDSGTNQPLTGQKVSIGCTATIIPGELTISSTYSRWTTSDDLVAGQICRSCQHTLCWNK